MQEQPLVVVSADTHVAPSLEMLTEYCEAEYRAECDEFITRYRAQVAELPSPILPNPVYRDFGFDEAAIAAAFDEVQRLPLRNAQSDGTFDLAVRHTDMDFDGVAGDIIFHGSQNRQGLIEPMPFQLGARGIPANATSKRDLELEQAGIMMYNRWLADFCAAAPERHAGMVQIPIADLETSTRIVEWAAERGLRGVNFPAPQATMPPFEDASWDRFFATCADLQMPLTTHIGGGSLPPYYRGPGAFAILLQEFPSIGGRNLWHCIFSGLFDRHPALTLVITELPGTWFASALRDMDSVYEEVGHGGPALRRFLKRRPSEYVYTNVYFGISFMSRAEAEAAVELNLTDRVLWGSDYPHSEGTWMYFDEDDPERMSVTKLALSHTFAGLDENAIRRMAGLNAAECYRMDVTSLTRVASSIGPRLADVQTVPSDVEIPAEYTGLGFRTSGAYH